MQFFSGSPVCTIDRSPNFFVSAPPILMRSSTPHNNLYQSAKVHPPDISKLILNFGDHTLTNTCAVFLIKAAIGEQSPAKRPNCNQDSSVFLIRPVGTFCSKSPFVIKPFDGDSPQSYAPDWLSLSFYAEYQIFWTKISDGKEFGREHLSGFV